MEMRDKVIQYPSIRIFDVVTYIDQVLFPGCGEFKGQWKIRLGVEHAPEIAALLDLLLMLEVESIPVGPRYIEFVTSLSVIRRVMKKWESSKSSDILGYYPGLGNLHPVVLIRRALSERADQLWRASNPVRFTPAISEVFDMQVPMVDDAPQPSCQDEVTSVEAQTSFPIGESLSSENRTIEQRSGGRSWTRKRANTHADASVRRERNKLEHGAQKGSRKSRLKTVECEIRRLKKLLNKSAQENATLKARLEETFESVVRRLS